MPETRIRAAALWFVAMTRRLLVVHRRDTPNIGDLYSSPKPYIPALRRASCFSAMVRWTSLLRALPSGFLPRSTPHLMFGFQRRTPASMKGRMLSRTPSSRSGSQPIGCSSSPFRRAGVPYVAFWATPNPTSRFRMRTWAPEGPRPLSRPSCCRTSWPRPQPGRLVNCGRRPKPGWNNCRSKALRPANSAVRPAD